MIWLAFALVAGITVAAGTVLARTGDILAEKTKMGRTWTGLILVAATTSLPELFTGASAAVQDLPDLALGDVLGSSMFNLLILSMLDMLGGRVPLSARANQGHALTIGLGMLLVGVVGLGLLAPLPSVGWIGAMTPVILGIYLLAARLIFLFERRRQTQQASRLAAELRYAHVPLASAVRRYALAAAVVIAAAVTLPGIGEQLARDTGLGQALVGNLLIAITTSLPEVAVSLAAVRLGALDLAIGNILGSNLFNMLIVAVDDVFLTSGPLLSSVTGSSHLVSVLAVLIMNALLLIGLTYHALKKQLVVAWDTAGIALTYLVAVALIFALRGG
ncbi:conjugal transfer protein TraR [Deinococcus aerolatus]|uniref:Conjugal transfer protein TraR n=1 Tax=Deinococcus aerolatus TaxID=522487 RepID=A0ABQ2GFD1_9DEIO|nr:hypothetical protein [Deinococcus aerolatus]GGL90633.1 conjugal transfer protein TraR [Deinococcus aerolatus]